MRITSETYRMPWLSTKRTVNATTAAADVALGVTEREFSIVKDLTNVTYIEIPQPIVTVECRFKLTTDGANVNFDVWAGRFTELKKADLVRICTLDVECGLQDVKDESGGTHYADEITITNNSFNNTAAAVLSGNDTDLMARLTINMAGYDLLLFHGHTTFAENCIVEVSGY